MTACKLHRSPRRNCGLCRKESGLAPLEEEEAPLSELDAIDYNDCDLIDEYRGRPCRIREPLRDP